MDTARSCGVFSGVVQYHKELAREGPVELFLGPRLKPRSLLSKGSQGVPGKIHRLEKGGEKRTKASRKGKAEAVFR